MNAGDNLTLAAHRTERVCKTCRARDSRVYRARKAERERAAA